MSRVLNHYAGMTGVVLDFAGTTAPDGWLMCFGQTVKRSDYKNLFNVIGTTYGAGDGSTTFGLPDCRGRSVIAKDDMGGTAASRVTVAGLGVAATALGAVGGVETHTLTSAQMPQHNHGVTDTGHTHTITDPGHVHTLTDPGHSHNTNAIYFTGSNNVSGGSNANLNVQTLASTSATTGITMASKVTGITQASATTGVTTQNAGTGNAHPNVQPSIVLNKIIKT